MTTKEYLSQAKRLDEIINCRLRELEYWRNLACSVSGGGFEERHNPNRPTEAPFARCLDSLSWEDISRIMNVSLRTAHRIHGTALQKFPVPDGGSPPD